MEAARTAGGGGALGGDGADEVGNEEAARWEELRLRRGEGHCAYGGEGAAALGERSRPCLWRRRRVFRSSAPASSPSLLSPASGSRVVQRD
ncbi:Os12g0205766 [Oryza sativa Japonica Group]|uniref:Os12g0205766 protein n=1 Tax=Oryza sativa subsp. japonica TaxID=39947 RepID=A0A0P0Y802_ORYSJ|nr:Os12g0205766 [Oryza sativa Japonica Group]